MALWEARDLAEKDAFEAEVEPPWRREVVGLSAVLASWQASSRVFRNVTLHERLPSREAVSVPLPATLHEGVLRALQRRGVTSLYSHQQRAIEHALAGRDVVIATPTASGKSLCF